MSSLEELILVAGDCPVSKSHVPSLGRTTKTIARISYEVLIDSPFIFTEREFYHEVHVVRRNRHDLKIEAYNIKRSPLVKKYGWGIHRNHRGKLALIPMESDEYQRLQESIVVKKAYRTNKA